MTNIACCIRDEELLAELPKLLEREGLDCEFFRSEAMLVRALRHRGGVDLVLIDVAADPLADESLFSWLSCRSGEVVPVVVLSSQWSAEQVVGALNAGADDCIVRPFDNAELVARMKAVLRRSGASNVSRTRIEVADIVLDKNDGTLIDRGTTVDLAPREFTLAWLFFSNPGARLSRQAISLAVWGLDKDIANRAIEQHVYKLRKKINLCSARGVTIRAAYAQGYRLELSDGCAKGRYGATAHIGAPGEQAFM
jgi:DNA-binding response OmpR family regulator